MQGICHCGRVTWKLDTPPESVTACNCTLCRRYGVLWAYGYMAMTSTHPAKPPVIVGPMVEQLTSTFAKLAVA